MADHTRRLLTSIEQACEQYAAGGVSLADLQAAVEPAVTALEAGDKDLDAALRHFVAQLEYIRFMSDDSDQPREIAREVSRLRNEISNYRTRTQRT